LRCKSFPRYSLNVTKIFRYARGAVFLSLCATALAQDSHFLSTDAEPVRAYIKLSKKEAAPGDNFDVTVQVRIAKGYHIYGAGSTNAPFIVTSLDLPLPKGIQAAGDWIAPKPVRAKDGAMIYTNLIQFQRALKVKSDAPVKPLTLSVELHFQACDEKMCYPPNSLALETSLLVKTTNNPPAMN
jgi:DsbC/DsbD-like thiol-disulfide interchange protein